MNKRVIIAVTNDLSGDQRIHKVAVSLIGLGYEPVLAGRLLPESSVLTRIYKCKRFRIPARKGPLFYILFNIRLFFYLLFSRAGLFLANDLDTLPAVFLAGFIRRKKVVYDSHEYFTEVPELVGRPRVKSVWEFIEKLIFPHLKWVYTVNRSIANIYAVKYGVQVGVIRNVPFAQRPIPVIGVLPQGFTDGPVIMYQGAVNVGRGLEEVIRAMPMMPDCRFLIAGDGDIRKLLENLVKELDLGNRIHFTGRVPFEELSWYTKQATLGISLEQDIGLNYHYALPNKLFDYLHAGIPVIASDLPEIRQVVEDTQAGFIVDRFDPESLSQTILSILNNGELMKTWRQNALASAPQYIWEKEQEVLMTYFPPL